MPAPRLPLSRFAVAVAVLSAACLTAATGLAKPKAKKAAPTSPAAPPAAPAPEPVDDGVSRIGPIKAFPNGTPDWLVRAAFKCALDYTDEAAGFDCYQKLNVELNRDNDNALTHLRLYSWKYFRQRAASYIVSTEPFTLKVTRRDPTSIDGNSKTVKVFLYSRHRDNPAPIILRREAGQWRVYANSL
ncbi:MAG: hypothetical protein EXR79_09915 [Myxococcales bacterium]|nr:hypothetical protein [Myxococcales bacterium]